MTYKVRNRDKLTTTQIHYYMVNEVEPTAWQRDNTEKRVRSILETAKIQASRKEFDVFEAATEAEIRGNII